MALLTVEDLVVDYRSDGKVIRAVSGVSFELDKGEVLGLVGESGSGKSTVGRALLRLLPRNGGISGGRITFDGHDLREVSDSALRRLRWDRMAVIFQGAMKVLDPVYTVGAQISEAIRTHRRDVSRRAARKQSRVLLEAVGIDPSRARAYPHELSGGMKQRVNIAMAIALNPDLIIADEPTTALDVISQDNVMAKLLELQRLHESAMVLISHDMGLIAENCDRVAVMYSGQIVELGRVDEIFSAPAHPYTMGLINAIPDALKPRELVAIPGFPPPAHERPVGCQFAPRCPFKQAVCETDPPWQTVTQAHGSLCHFVGDREVFNERAIHQETWDGAEAAAQVDGVQPAVSAGEGIQGGLR